mmetsp:Transcript_1592/g.2190  ORF Transcript_1592/g.2190 Transcript_1592/m.2190 type:complete len:384 (+) Transcript_1592:34-1185(+)
MMNSTDNLAQQVPDRIDIEPIGSRPPVHETKSQEDATGTSEEEHASIVEDEPNIEGPGKELTAASALTSLVKPPSSEDVEEEFDIPQRFTKSGRKKATPFPMKLMKVLSTKEYMDIITWLPDGKSFTIVRPKAFVGDILPKEFKQAKYSSFTRKLHRWGFQRHLRGEEAGAFFHKLFQRGRLDLVERMSCYKPDQSKTPSAFLGTKQPGLGFRDPIMARPQMSRSLMMHQQGQQQQQQSLMGMQGNPLHGQAQRTGAGGDVGSVDRLNAAIELEVNRRLKERITAATLSRQALALMQQQQLPNNDPRNGFGGSSAGGSNPLGLNLLGGQEGLGLNNAETQQQLQLQQLQQQQAQLQRQQQQLQQQQGVWGGQAPLSFENNQGV